MTALREWYERASALPTSQRVGWLAEHCPDPDTRSKVTALLRAESEATGNDLLARSLAARMQGLEHDVEAIVGAGWLGRRIGPFRLLSLLGQGGMAVVFLARREEADFDQQVAVKLLRRGPYSSTEQRWFRRERQALAALSHPNIAHLIDGGLDEEGNAYLAMEYVDGIPLTHYCTERQAGLRERLVLMHTVCQAVEAAHRALIVHRDLKPSNILVATDGTVKLLDFGIAKLLDNEEADATRGPAALTPEYAAPEQFTGSAITTATDVYALGVLLHELLLGVRPERNTTRRPSQSALLMQERADAGQNMIVTGNVLRGDLDNIVLKALCSEPALRYASAGALAADIDAYLDGRPVSAHPPSAWYRTRKFMLRHRGGVTLTAALVLAIFASLGLALWQARAARLESVRANTVRDFIVELLDAAKAELPRDTRATPEVLVDAAIKRLDADTSLPDATRAELLHVLGVISASNGQFEQALSLFGKANDIQTLTLPADDQRRLDTGVQRAGALAELTRFDGASALLESLLPDLRRRPTQTTIDALTSYSGIQLRAGHSEQAVTLAREAANVAATVYSPDSPQVLAAAAIVGAALSISRQYPQAVEQLEPLIARWRALGIAEDRYLSEAMSNLALAYEGMGRLDDAERTHRDALALKQRIYRAPHGAIASSMSQLADFLQRRGDLDAAHTLLGDALVMQRELLGNAHPDTLATLNRLAMLELSRRDFAKAEAYEREALAPCMATPPLRDRICPDLWQGLGSVQFQAGDYEHALESNERAIDEFSAILGKDDGSIAGVISTRASLLRRLKRFPDALQAIDRALAIYADKGLLQNEPALVSQWTRAAILIDLGRAAEVQSVLDPVIAQWRSPQADIVKLQGALRTRAQAAMALGQRDEARAIAREALQLNVPSERQNPAVRQSLQEIAGP